MTQESWVLCREALIPPSSLIIDFAVPHVSEDFFVVGLFAGKMPQILSGWLCSFEGGGKGLQVRQWCSAELQPWPQLASVTAFGNHGSQATSGLILSQIPARATLETTHLTAGLVKV